MHRNTIGSNRDIQRAICIPRVHFDVYFACCHNRDGTPIVLKWKVWA